MGIVQLHTSFAIIVDPSLSTIFHKHQAISRWDILITRLLPTFPNVRSVSILAALLPIDYDWDVP